MTNHTLAYLAAEDLKLAASLLYQAYHDDELLLRLFQGDKPDYEKRLRAAIREDLNAFWESKQPLVGVFDGERLLGVVCLTVPGESFGPGRYWHWRVKMMLTAGYVSTKQVVEKERLIQAAIPHKTFHMIAFIAVQPNLQQQGIGDLLVQAAETVLAESKDSAGLAVYLTRDRYLALFEHHNFSKIADLNVDGIEGRLMFCERPRSQPEQAHE